MICVDSQIVLSCNDFLGYLFFSLNKEKRQRELLRVTKENQAILQRITLRQPEYSAKRWADIWDEEQKFIDNISHYPKDWWTMKVGL